jgi:hypothetical protein
LPIQFSPIALPSTSGATHIEDVVPPDSLPLPEPPLPLPEPLPSVASVDSPPSSVEPELASEVDGSVLDGLDVDGPVVIGDVVGSSLVPLADSLVVDVDGSSSAQPKTKLARMSPRFMLRA